MDGSMCVSLIICLFVCVCCVCAWRVDSCADQSADHLPDTRSRGEKERNHRTSAHTGVSKMSASSSITGPSHHHHPSASFLLHSRVSASPPSLTHAIGPRLAAIDHGLHAGFQKIQHKEGREERGEENNKQRWKMTNQRGTSKQKDQVRACATMRTSIRGTLTVASFSLFSPQLALPGSL